MSCHFSYETTIIRRKLWIAGSTFVITLLPLTLCAAAECIWNQFAPPNAIFARIAHNITSLASISSAATIVGILSIGYAANILFNNRKFGVFLKNVLDLSFDSMIIFLSAILSVFVFLFLGSFKLIYIAQFVFILSVTIFGYVTFKIIIKNIPTSVSHGARVAYAAFFLLTGFTLLAVVD